MNDLGDLSHIIPPQQARSQRFLMKVLEAAETIMRRDGVEGLTMPAVAQEAGVSVGGIYRRFQTKQDLLRAIKDRFLTRAEQSVADALDMRNKTLDDVVRNFIDTILKGGPGADLFGLMVESKAQDPSMRDRGNATVGRLRDSLAQALAPHRGEIAHADPDAAIDMAVFILIAAIMRRLRGYSSPAERISWSAMRRELSRLVIVYLRTPG
jgi:AcrR family transcriptional regulator